MEPNELVLWVSMPYTFYICYCRRKVNSKTRSLEIAHALFDKMPERNVYSWSQMIGEYVHHGHCEETLKLFSQMKQEAGMELSQFTVASVVRVCSNVAGSQFEQDNNGERSEIQLGLEDKMRDEHKKRN